MKPRQRPLPALFAALALIAASAADAALLDDCRRNGKNPVQVSSCLREAQIKAEEALNAAVAQARKQAGNDPRALRSFDERQQAWKIRRARECQRRFENEAPGSAAGEVRMACEIERTRERLTVIGGSRR